MTLTFFSFKYLHNYNHILYNKTKIVLLNYAIIQERLSAVITEHQFLGEEQSVSIHLIIQQFTLE